MLCQINNINYCFPAVVYILFPTEFKQQGKYQVQGGGQEILYDLNGNMTGMPDKGISLIRYNYLNLPDQLNNAKGFETATVKTKYGSDGSKLQKENTTVVDGISGSTTVKKTTDYLDGFQYLKQKVSD